MEEPEASKIITFHANRRLNSEDRSYRHCHYRKINKHKSWHTWENPHEREHFTGVPSTRKASVIV